MALSRQQHDEKLERARNGDMNAFAEVFETYRPLLHSVAYHLVGPDDCDDVVMDAFLKVWRTLPRFRKRTSMKNWLCKVTRNCALDHIRKRTRREAHTFREPESGEDPDGPFVENVPDVDSAPPDRAAEQSELAEVLDRALAKLPDHHRIPVVLREIEGLSYKEIAAATGVSVGTVMSRLFYAKRRLRRLLEDVGP